MQVSAGVVVVRRTGEEAEVLLAHPGGPFWKNKDLGAWTIPKGLLEPDEDLLAGALREFFEETGLELDGQARPLAPIRQKSGKLVHAFAVEADPDLSRFRSEAFEMEWPPRSGRTVRFPEIDRIAWFGESEAMLRILAAQQPLVLEALRGP
jgi:predicted NUDIX family NTP pyrophosphohydrolase